MRSPELPLLVLLRLAARHRQRLVRPSGQQGAGM
jgi:hypothetical protein